MFTARGFVETTEGTQIIETLSRSASIIEYHKSTRLSILLRLVIWDIPMPEGNF
jgi:hypothetical protein